MRAMLIALILLAAPAAAGTYRVGFGKAEWGAAVILEDGDRTVVLASVLFGSPALRGTVVGRLGPEFPREEIHVLAERPATPTLPAEDAGGIAEAIRMARRDLAPARLAWVDLDVLEGRPALLAVLDPEGVPRGCLMLDNGVLAILRGRDDIPAVEAAGDGTLSVVSRRLDLPPSAIGDRRADPSVVTRIRIAGRSILLVPGHLTAAARAAIEAEARRLELPGQVVGAADDDVGVICDRDEWPTTPDARHGPDLARRVTDALLGDLRPARERDALENAALDRERLAALGSLEEIDGLPVMRIRGGAYAMGLQHGRLLGERIRARLAGTDRRPDGLASTRGLMRRIPAPVIDEIRGIADGAEISLDEALLLATLGGVTSGARMRTVDGDGTLWGTVDPGTGIVVTVVTPASGHRVVTVGECGSPGAVAALSDRGLAAFANRPGDGPSISALRLRHAAQYAGSEAQAAGILRDAVGPDTFLLLERGGAVRLGPSRSPAHRRGVVALRPGRGRIHVVTPELDVVLDLDHLLTDAPVPLARPFDVPVDPVVTTSRLEPLRSFLNGCRVTTLAYRSPVPSGDARNDLVPVDLYEPTARAARGAVILMPIWRGGGPVLERYVAAHLVHHGYATMIVPLPYQFGRAPIGVSSGRLTITDDLERNRRVLVQAVADARAARILLRNRGYREDRICVMGISLGGHVAALAYGVDPGFARGAFVLTGGDLADVLWNDSRDTRGVKLRLLARGVGFAEVQAACAPIEPLRHVRPWRGRGAMLAAALRDQTVPPANVDSLRTALGDPPVLWVDATHTSGLTRLPEILGWIAARLDAISVQSADGEFR